MFSLTFTEEAALDIQEAALWYDMQSQKSGERFYNELNRTLAFIENNPLQYQRISNNIRQAPLKNFPYSLFYYLIKDMVRVIACVHQARDIQRILKERT